jgi:hypothetical protein
MALPAQRRLTAKTRHQEKHRKGEPLCPAFTFSQLGEEWWLPGVRNGSRQGTKRHVYDWDTVFDPIPVGVRNPLMPDNSTTAFLYQKGVFWIISVPGGMPNSTTLFGTIPKFGLILGSEAPKGGFIAKCQ